MKRIDYDPLQDVLEAAPPEIQRPRITIQRGGDDKPDSTRWYATIADVDHPENRQYIGAGVDAQDALDDLADRLAHATPRPRLVQ